MADHANGTDPKTGPFEHQMERPWGEVREVTRHVEPIPSRAKPSEWQAVDVGNGDVQFAAGNEQAISLAQDLQGGMHVFECVPHGYQFEASGP